MLARPPITYRIPILDSRVPLDGCLVLVLQALLALHLAARAAHGLRNLRVVGGRFGIIPAVSV